MTASYSLRPIQPGDMEFLYQVYASTRADEMTLVDWPAAQIEAFLRMQFTAQHQYYSENYTGADFLVIQVAGQAVGRLYRVHWPDEIRIMDIALLPEQCGRGLGSQVLQDILADGAQANLPVSIHVERFNPALRLYQRLGFQLVEDKGVYLFLKWYPDGQPPV